MKLFRAKVLLSKVLQMRTLFYALSCCTNQYNRVHLVPQLYINVNDVEGQRRFDILESEDTN